MKSSSQKIREGRFETKEDVGTLGGSVALTGVGCSGCALLTVVGIPFLIVTLPFAIVGIIIIALIPFLKTRDVKCPNCGEVNRVLKYKGFESKSSTKSFGLSGYKKSPLKAFSCRECGVTVTFAKDGSPKI